MNIWATVVDEQQEKQIYLKNIFLGDFNVYLLYETFTTFPQFIGDTGCSSGVNRSYE